VSYVFEIVFALATLALPELGWTVGPSRPWGVAALVLVPYALGWCARRALLAGRFRVGALLERALVGAPVVLQAAAVGELGWLAALQQRGVGQVTLEDWLDLRVLLALAPYLVYQVAAIDARARTLVFPPDTAGRLRSFQLRLFLAALLPFLACLAGANVLSRSPVWEVRVEEVGLLGGLAATCFMGLFLYAMPFFLRHAWDTTPLERGWARTTLEQVARGAGFRYRELLLWRTGQQMSNAAIVGFTERSRLVFFSDLLLQQLGPRELAAVFAHEMGHARRAHSIVFGTFALCFYLAAQQIARHSGIESQLWGGLLVLSLVVLWYLAFGYLSRRFELEADLESLRIVGDSDALVRALELVTGAHAHARSSWRHFSTKDRVAFLRAAERDPLIGIRLRLKLARWRNLGFALFAVAALLEVRDQARAWDSDWLVADLRLGRFEEAAARAESGEIDAEVAALARRAISLPEGSRDVRALAAAAAGAWVRGDATGAREWLELARLRGARNVDPWLAALERGGAALAELPAEWRDLLQSLDER
jgi:Zn-dependent protease with chaperone function